MPLGHDRNLTLRHHLVTVELAEHVVGAVYQRSIRATLTEHLPLLADLAQQHLHRECAGLSGIGVEQVTKELVGGAGLGDQDQPIVRVGRAPGPFDGGRRRVEDVPRLLEQHLAGSRHPHAAINNAGISGPTGDGALQDPLTVNFDVIRTDVETNVLGAMRVINAALPLLRRSPSPRIVNVSTNMASLGLRTGPIMSAYAPSKTMLNAMTVQYARRFAETDPNILINAVCPGFVPTDFTGFSGSRTAAEGAAIAVRFATLPDGGPTGGFFDDGGTIPW